MIGGAVPHDDQLVLGPFGPESAQNIDGVFAVGAGIGPQPHFAFVVEIEAVERELVRQTRRGRGDPEAPAALRPAVAEIGILVDVGFVQVDQQMAVVLGTGQQILDLLDKGLPALRIGPAEQLLPSSTTIPDDAGRRGSSRGSRSGRTARAPSRPDGATSSAAADRHRLRAGLRLSVGRHGPSRQGRLSISGQRSYDGVSGSRFGRMRLPHNIMEATDDLHRSSPTGSDRRPIRR